MPRSPEPRRGRIFLLLTAAGSSVRFGGSKKEFAKLGGSTVLRCSLEPFLNLNDLCQVVITCQPGMEDETRKAVGADLADELARRLPLGIRFVPGGSTRQESVAAGLEAMPDSSISAGAAEDAGLEGEFPDEDIVLVHDAARPWASSALVAEVANATRIHGAAIPLSDLADTPKELGDDGFIAAHPERSRIKAAQTPQGFYLAGLKRAHKAARDEGRVCTDDSSLWERFEGRVFAVQGERENRKITFPEDLSNERSDEECEEIGMDMRIGEGWDIHPLVEGRVLVLGGLELDFPKGEAGHSDGDVLWHAAIDAILGAACLGDIGAHFPPGDRKWKDADSSLLASAAAGLARDRGWEIVNLDCTVIIEAPRLGPHREAIRDLMASVLAIPPDRVSVKAKTFEGFGEVGEGRAVEARAVALLRRSSSRGRS
ncbi:MAG TPA: 2-C-methyl-D-erythritol 2,4-cyclodiphosphate synthase [Rectinemataceae bacterium]